MTEQSTSRLSNGDSIAANILEAVRSQVPDLHGQSREEIKEAIFARTATLREQNADRAIDGPSQQWLMVCSFLLAAYQELQPHVGDAQEVLSILPMLR